MSVQRIKRLGTRTSTVLLPRSRRRTVFQSLDFNGSFLKDTRLGRILHPGQLSLREHTMRDSLHVTVGADNRLYAHIDTVSPLAGRAQGGVARYSLPRVLLHNASTIVERVRCALQDERRRLRCELECEVDLEQPGPDRHSMTSERDFAVQRRIEAVFGFR